MAKRAEIAIDLSNEEWIMAKRSGSWQISVGKSGLW